MINFDSSTIMIFRKKNKKKTPKKIPTNFLPSFRYTGFFTEFVSMKACCPVALVKILSECWVGCHTASVSTIAWSTVPCMILVLSSTLHDRLWCGFILCLTCTFTTRCLHSLPLPKSLTFLVRESKLLQKHHEGFSDGYGFIFPLFIVILYLYERPVLNGLWLRGGKSSSNFTTSLFSDFHGFVIHLLSDAWLYLRLSNSLHLEKGVFTSSAFIFQNFLGEEFPFRLFYTTDDKSL